MDLKILLLTSNNYAEIVREQKSELPDLETIKRYEEKCSNETLLYNLGVITPNGELVGFGRYVSGTWDPILKPGYVEVTVKVDKEWRNKGIGSWILDEIENRAHKNNAKALQTNIQDIKEMDIEWAKKKGFEITNHTFESQLNLSSFDMSQYDSVCKELESSGIRFTNLAEYPQNADSNNRFWDFWWELVTDVPGMQEKPRPDNERMISLAKDFDKKGFILAADGEQWVALSMILKENDDLCYNSMTGVKKEYRGKGLALAIKVKAIEYALHHNVKYIRTHNNSKNLPMLSVNKKLGYKSKPGFFGLMKPIK
ncbi:GNAT family N-acetyltransferase [Salirhabdus salicampi]|uniref:GNAT family N-acetyltransferase n=1 Tax=Salirhabdus salicampi TaxID=476102 RepID=UPI0020C1E47C|nr:GNAT family N-acetyltransferase [Salirhabdus salicampi]MCP8615696.1 GNAT family N-acetyltransferase [Salirhabdus salicampi]